MSPPRSHRPELLDDPDRSPAELARSLRDVEAVNRWLGGYRALRRHLDPLRDEPAPIRVLDVGTGDAATLLHLRRWAPPDWSFVGIEISAAVTTVAARRVGEAGSARTSSRPTATPSRDPARAIRILRGDGLALPFADDSFDAAVCTLTLHHFDDQAAVDLLREMARVATRKVVVNDLERSTLHHLGALLLSATIWRGSPITRHDGPLSVRRAFTAEELEAIGKAAELRDFSVRRRPVYRLILDGAPRSNPPGQDPLGSSEAPHGREGAGS